MKGQRILKLIHLAGTAWLILNIGLILVWILRSAGFKWWLIFSLSGFSALTLFFIISIYLFAVYRGFARSQKLTIEHPLTTSIYYSIFYDTTPFLGALAGCLASIGANKLSDYLLVISYGSFATTFFVWIIIDPLIALIEMLLPASRNHRRNRIADAKQLSEEQKEQNKKLLAEIMAQSARENLLWQEKLQPQALDLLELLTAKKFDYHQAERNAVDIGFKAWQAGGLNCMQNLFDTVITACKKREQKGVIANYLTFWWDGIGNWRAPSL